MLIKDNLSKFKQIFFLLVFFSLVGWLVLFLVEREMKNNLKSLLTTTLNSNVETLKIWLEKELKNVRFWAQEPRVRKLVLDLNEKIAEGEYSKGNLLRTQELKKLRSLLGPVNRNFKHTGFVILDKNGLQIAALLKEPVGQSDLIHRSGFVKKALEGETVFSLPFKGEVPLPDVSGVFHEEWPTMFVASPIINDDKEIIAVLTFRMRPELDFTRVMEINRPGNSGETYAFDPQGTLLSNSRFTEQLVATGLLPDKPPYHSMLNISIRDPGGNLLDGYRPEIPREKQSLTLMAQSATSGVSGINVDGYNDYRGVPVVGVWVWLPQYGFGVTSELDKNEALKPYIILRNTVLFLLIGWILLSCIALIFRFHEIQMEAKQIAAEKALEKTEMDMRIVIKEMADGLVKINEEGMVTLFNASAERIFGYTSLEIVGRHVSVLIPESKITEYTKYLDAFLASTPAHSFGNCLELMAKNKNGNEFPLEISVSEVHLDGERMFTGICRDITERKAMEKDIQKYTNDLESSNRELEEFAHIISHDLKEPLRGINNFSKFLLEDYIDVLDKNGKSMLQSLIKLSTRLDNLIGNLLNYSEVSRLSYHNDKVDINEVVEEVLESLQPVIDEKNVEIRKINEMPRIVCDRVRTGQIFQNLISNSMKYNDSENPVIEIGCKGIGENPKFQGSNGAKLSMDAKSSCVFFVRDNGIGIAKKHQDIIFNMFKRLHGQNKHGGGTGAGLAFVKKIVERHHGKVWVESIVGEGSTFFFTLQGEPDNVTI